MKRMMSLLTVATFLATALLAVPVSSIAAGLPDGVRIDVLAEYESKTPGVEKVLFRKITIEPGKSLSLTVPAQSVCQGTKGVLHVDNKTTGKVTVHNAGDRWSTVPGHKVSLINKGSVDHEHLFYTMVPKK